MHRWLPASYSSFHLLMNNTVKRAAAQSVRLKCPALTQTPHKCTTPCFVGAPAQIMCLWCSAASWLYTLCNSAATRAHCLSCPLLERIAARKPCSSWLAQTRQLRVSPYLHYHCHYLITYEEVGMPWLIDICRHCKQCSRCLKCKEAKTVFKGGLSHESNADC